MKIALVYVFIASMLFDPAPARASSSRSDLLTVVAMIESRETAHSFRIKVLNDQNLKPVSRLYPPSIGRMPTTMVIDASAPIDDDGLVLRPLALGPGCVIKLFGFKSRTSAVVKAFRVEVLSISKWIGGPG